jgi:L,D-transpeptidase catalytic domain
VMQRLARLSAPAILLALLAAGSHASSVSPVNAASVPPPLQPAVVATATVQEAVNTPATAAFAQGADGLSPKVLAAALDAVACAKARGVSGRDDLLTVIDYSLPSTQPRLWVLDLAHGKVLFHELVAHGAGSGDLVATHFSNTDDSRQTSLGLFLTAGTYEGGNGYSLRLKGLDEGVNDRAESRNIVMHGAWYVSADHARQYGRLGRSWGCPALSQQMAKPVIDAIKGGSFVFSYSGADKSWLQKASTSLHGPSCPLSKAKKA